ncbi:MATE family efflux transporter, partial [Salmonella enterica]|uniref:MATE family efflux transporter n=1 Tax=Salmonella enterica TaxID=28901 RepID=UPI0020C4BC08
PNTFIQAALYDIGTGNVPLQNGAIAANNINNFNYAFIEAFASATMAFTAQNFGAKKKENIRKVLTYGLIWVAILEAL